MIFNIPLPPNKFDRQKVIKTIRSMENVASCAHSPKIFSFDVEDMEQLDMVMGKLEEQGLHGIELSNQVSIGQSTSSIKRTDLGLIRLL